MAVAFPVEVISGFFFMGCKSIAIMNPNHGNTDKSGTRVPLSILSCPVHNVIHLSPGFVPPWVRFRPQSFIAGLVCPSVERQLYAFGHSLLLPRACVRIFSMYLAGYTMQEIADVVGVHKDSVSETCRKFIDLEKSDKLLASFQDSEFETPSCRKLPMW